MVEADKIFQEYNVKLSPKQLQNFQSYARILEEWNKKMNLTAPQSTESIYRKHFVDSLMMDRVMELNTQSLLDVGSGAGFPALPLKILHLGLRVTVVDSTKKRIRFLEHIAKELQLDMHAVHGRIEEHDQKEDFDIVTARAVASLNILCELCLPFVKVGGYFIAYKGKNFQKELDESAHALDLLGGKIKDIYRYSIDDTDRVLIMIEKTASTPYKYPRKFSQVKKTPL